MCSPDNSYGRNSLQSREQQWIMKQQRQLHHDIITSLSQLPCFYFMPLASPASIRLIKLHQPPGRNPNGVEDPYTVSCEMVQFPIHKAPPFTALSYTWGKPRLRTRAQKDFYIRKHPILCNGEVLKVTQNLCEALRSINTREADEIRSRKYNKTPLIHAAESGDLDEVLYQLRAGASLDAQDNFRETALHYAAENGHFHVVKALVFAGCNISAIDGRHRSPLDCVWEARRGSWEETAKFLQLCHEYEDTALDLDTGLRRRGGDTQYLWVDSICIDQENELEKSVQVGMMGQIYGSAKAVLAWIGDDAEWQKPAMQMILGASWQLEEAQQFRQLSSTALSAMIKDPMQSELEHKGSIPRSIAIHWLRGLDWKQLKSVGTLGLMLGFDNTWYQRAWVIQEAVLARRLTVLWGTHLIPWDVLAYMVSIISWYHAYSINNLVPWKCLSTVYVNHDDYVYLRSSTEITQTRRVIHSLVEQRSIYHTQGQLRMTESFSLSRNAKCANLKDKIFSVAAITSFVELTEHGIQTMDLHYDWPVTVLFAKVTKAMLAIDGLGVLSLCGRQQYAPGIYLPTWNIDLTSSRFMIRGVPEGDLGLHRDSEEFHRSWSFSNANEDEMLIKGHRWDTISAVSEQQPTNSALEYDRVISWLGMVDSTSQQRPEEPLRLLWQTVSQNLSKSSLAADRSYSGFKSWIYIVILAGVCNLPQECDMVSASKEVNDFFDQDYREYAQSDRRDRMAAALSLLEKAGIALPGLPSGKINSEEDLKYYHDIWTQHAQSASNFTIRDEGVVPDRRLFKTERRQQLGLGPNDAEVGDIVVFVPNVTVPYIIRRVTKGKYWLMGEAFIYNVMQKVEGHGGEAKAFFDSACIEFGEEFCIV